MNDDLPEPIHTLPFHLLPIRWQVRLRENAAKQGVALYARRLLTRGAIVATLIVSILTLSALTILGLAIRAYFGYTDWLATSISVFIASFIVVRFFMMTLRYAAEEDMAGLTKNSARAWETSGFGFLVITDKPPYRHEYALNLWLTDDIDGARSKQEALTITANKNRPAATVDIPEEPRRL